MRGRLRDLLGDQLARRPTAMETPASLDVGHRVFVRAAPEQVWQVLRAAPAALDAATACVRVLPLPVPSGQPPRVVAMWRRSNGRLRAGLSEVVDVQPASVVTRSADGASPLTLTTATESLDGGCVVSQHLRGQVTPSAGDRTRQFGAMWLERSLLQLKGHVEGVPIPDTHLELSRAGIEELDAGSRPGLVPVIATVSVAVDLPPVRLWDFLDATLAEPLVSPGVQCVLRTALDDDARVHVVSVHHREDGTRQVHVTQLVEAVRPHRFVERSLSADVETDVVTSISPAGEGSIVTETFTGWLPPGAGTTSGAGPVEELMRARLETIRRLAEAGLSPQRDPRTGFLPPGTSLPPEHVDERPSVTTPPAVLLPPPHLVVPAPMFGRPGLPLGWADPLEVLPLFGDLGL